MRYARNATWLLRFAPFRVMSFSSAYVAPFYLAHGLNQAEIFMLQSIFSAAYLLWEIPSGWLADRFGRARCIKLSAPIAALGFIAYGFSSHFWQFALCELVIATSSGLISGADRALLYDSLKADGRSDEFERTIKHMNARGFFAAAIGTLLAIPVVQYLGIGATLVLDGAMTAVGMFFVLRLVEAPVFSHPESPWKHLGVLARRSEVRWLVALTVTFDTATYFGVWLSAPYYLSVGIPASLFGLAAVIRNLWKAGWAQWFHPKRHIGLMMSVFVALAFGGYAAMAVSSIWLAWLLLSHDTVWALQGAPLLNRLNQHMHDGHRATMNSAVNLTERLVYTLFGPLVGFMVDQAGLQTGALATGVLTAGVAAIAVIRLYRCGTFAKKEG